MARRFLLLCLTAACLSQVACFERLLGNTVADDAAKGATIGGLLGGPGGAAVGAGVAGMLSLIARSFERKKMKREHARQLQQLTDVVKNPALAAAAQAIAAQRPADDFHPQTVNGAS